MKSQKPKVKAEKSQPELRAALEQKFRSLKPTLDDAFAAYKQALADGTFDDASGEPEGTGEARKAAAQEKIQRIIERAERLDAALKSSEPLTNLEALSDIDYATYATDIDPTKAGEEWSLHEESTHPNFETAKPFIPDLSAFNGKPRHEVFQHILATYGSTHYIPGKEYRDWLAANPDDTPATLKDATIYYFFPGSLTRDGGGRWGVPSADWDGSKWYRHADWLSNDWNSNYRVVLLEK